MAETAQEMSDLEKMTTNAEATLHKLLLGLSFLKEPAERSPSSTRNFGASISSVSTTLQTLVFWLVPPGHYGNGSQNGTDGLLTPNEGPFPVFVPLNLRSTGQ